MLTGQTGKKLLYMLQVLTLDGCREGPLAVAVAVWVALRRWPEASVLPLAALRAIVDATAANLF